MKTKQETKRLGRTKIEETIETFTQKWGRFILALVTFFVFATTPLYEKYSQKYIDDSLKSTAVLYATLRTMNGAVSIIKHSSMSVGVAVEGNLALGEVLDPIDDAIERFSTLITTSLWIFGAQKALFEISKTDAVLVLAVLLSLVYLLFPSDVLKKTLLVLIVLRLFIPFSALVSHYANDAVFNPPIEKELAFLSLASHKQIATHKELAQNQSFWSKIGGSVSDSAQQIKEITMFYIDHMERIVSALLNLAIAYVGKTFFNLVFLPMLLFYAAKSLW